MCFFSNQITGAILYFQGISNYKQRIFRYATNKELALQTIAFLCAIASGGGMTMVNLVFGRFITLVTDYVSGASTPEAFRSGAGVLGYVFSQSR